MAPDERAEACRCKGGCKHDAVPGEVLCFTCLGRCEAGWGEWRFAACVNCGYTEAACLEMPVAPGDPRQCCDECDHSYGVHEHVFRCQDCGEIRA